MKKIISILLAWIMIMGTCLTGAAANAAETFLFSVNPFGGGAEDIDTVKLFTDKQGEHFLFLPAGSDPGRLTVYFDPSVPVTADGKPLTNGAETDIFKDGGVHILRAGGAEYPVTVLVSSGIPAMFLSTESGSMASIHASKDNKEPGNIRIYENGEQTLDSPLKQIKGRGNSTWSLSKKPYNIKFDKKTDLFGMGKAKKWTLLASYYDPTFMRNELVFSLADRFGLQYSSETRYVDLYANGEYLGSYVVCESVEVGGTRVDIDDLEKANEDANADIDIEERAQISTGYGLDTKKWVDIPNEPENITGGYLLEFDFASRYMTEISGFQTKRGQCVTVGAPEYATKGEIDYISALYQQAEDALFSPDGKNALGKHYTEYFDLDSLAEMYIIQEFTKNTDSAQSSFYLIKDADSDLFVASPVWDYDLSLGIGTMKQGQNTGRTSGWFANSVCYDEIIGEGYHQYQNDTIFRTLYKTHADFRAAAAEKWQEFTALIGEDLFTMISDRADTLVSSAVMNAFRWNSYPDSLTPEAKAESFRGSVSSLENFITRRTDYLMSAFSGNGAVVYYEPNGGKGTLIDRNIYMVGDVATILGVNETDMTIAAPADKPYFAGWNTEADGSGKAYYEGRPLMIGENVTVLYAQWSEEEPAAPCFCLCHSDNSVARILWKLIVLLYRMTGIEKTCECGEAHY